jgi:kynurenine formamidase
MSKKSVVKSVLGLTAFCAATVFATGAVAHDTKECRPSKFGKDDQIGNANYITPAKVLSAMKLVTTGKTYRLGIETNRATPAYPPRNFSVMVVQPGQVNGTVIGDNKLTYNDDIVMGWNGVGSQIDGFGHIGTEGVYYNCTHGEDFAKITGLTKFGVETMPAFVTKAIILDIAGLMGVEYLKEGTPINVKEIEGAMKRQGIKSIEKGDIVILHTGWLKLLGKDDKLYGSLEPGLSKEGALYLVDKGVVAVGADTWGLEAVPFEKGVGVFEVHQILLQQNGIYILETMNVEPLVKDGAYEVLFTLGASRLTGAVQAIINPIAIK